MKTVTVYTTTNCPYCTRAKSLLDQLGVKYNTKDVTDDLKLREEMSQKYSWQTVPMILVGDEFIGGYDDMAELHAKGKLMPKINS